MLKDEELLLALQSHEDAKRNAAFKIVYNDQGLIRMAYSEMQRYQDCSKDEFEEIWQETMMGLVDALAQNRFQGESKFSTYIVRIAVNKWLSALKKMERHRKHSELAGAVSEGSEEALLELSLADSDEAYAQLLDYAIRQMSERCQGMLKDAATGQGLDYLTGTYAFSSKNMAKKELYNCRERIRKFIRSKPLLQEKLKNWLYRINLH